MPNHLRDAHPIDPQPYHTTHAPLYPAVHSKHTVQAPYPLSRACTDGSRMCEGWGSGRLHTSKVAKTQWVSHACIQCRWPQRSVAPIPCLKLGHSFQVCVGMARDCESHYGASEGHEGSELRVQVAYLREKSCGGQHVQG